MTPYVVYDANGRILRGGVMDESDVPLQAMEGESVLVVGALPSQLSRYRVDGGALVRVATIQPEATEYESWSLVNGDWVSVPTLAGIKRQAMMMLEARIQVEEKGVDRVVRDLVLSMPTHPAYGRMSMLESKVSPYRVAMSQVQLAQSEQEVNAVLDGVGL